MALKKLEDSYHYLIDKNKSNIEETTTDRYQTLQKTGNCLFESLQAALHQNLDPDMPVSQTYREFRLFQFHQAKRFYEQKLDSIKEGSCSRGYYQECYDEALIKLDKHRDKYDNDANAGKYVDIEKAISRATPFFNALDPS